LDKHYICAPTVVEERMPVQLRVSKWGNSLGLRVPRDIAARAGLTEGTRVEIEGFADGRIVITPSRRRFTLEELVAGMTPEREHPLEDDGPRGQ
jgi:antitoxin MazE